MDIITEFFKHNTMMNDRLLDACEGLTPEQLATTVDGTFGTIAATLVHIANAQNGYAPRFLGRDRPERLEPDPFPGFDRLREHFDLGNAMLEEAAARAGEDHTVQVSGDDPVGTWTMPAVLLLLQAINHGTEHRSQIATILTQLGQEPPEMDGWNYFFDAGWLEEVTE
jgi:uncharacterized damage-inducible protein DinB